MPGFEVFSEMFSSYFDEKVHLPVTAGRMDHPSTMRGAGWVVKAVAYALDGETVFELYAIHPAYEDRHARFYLDGRVERLPILSQGISMNENNPEEDLQERITKTRNANQRLISELNKLGLL